MGILHKAACLLCAAFLFCALVMFVTVRVFDAADAEVLRISASAAKAGFSENFAALREGLSLARSSLIASVLFGMVAFAALSSALLRSIVHGLAAMHAATDETASRDFRPAADREESRRLGLGACLDALTPRPPRGSSTTARRRARRAAMRSRQPSAAAPAGRTDAATTAGVSSTPREGNAR